MVIWVQGGSSRCPTTPWRTLPHGDPGGGAGTGWDGSPELQARPFSGSAPEGPPLSARPSPAPHLPTPPPPAPLGLLPTAQQVALQSAELLLRHFQLRPQRLVGQPQLGVLRLRLQLLSGPGLQLLFQLGCGGIEAGENRPHVPRMLRLPLTPNNSGDGNIGPRASRTPGSAWGTVRMGPGLDRCARLPAGTARQPLTSRCRSPARSSSCSRLCSSSSRRPLLSSRGTS